MANRLAAETSPYLLQHADNPVDWWPWSPEAFAEARRRDLPVLLSVGYSSCHWCHVMAEESFEDEATAAYLNEHFVAVKVDREERPDIDSVYMDAVQAATGHGGWPMTVFMTADGEPFYFGTYYPPEPRHGMPSFVQLLEGVHAAWHDRRDEVTDVATRITGQLAHRGVSYDAPLPPDAALLDAALEGLDREFDESNGGFGGAPKFPPSMTMEFLLRHHARTGSARALEMAEQTAEAMVRGGLYDQLGGGFARYAVDAGWAVPHFEKMLYDNALLLRAYAHLAKLGASSAALAERVTRETGEFLLRDLRTAEGAFAASLDADTEGVEGLTYVWTPEELQEVLGEQDAQWAAELLHVTSAGTFEHGASTLQLRRDPDDLPRWQRIREALLDARSRRPQPGIDDKIVTSWNGMALTGLVEAAAVLQEPQWIEAAERAADLLTELHLVDGRLRRSSRDGVVGAAAGVLEDHGCLAEGLLALHQATGRRRWLETACALLDTALEQFADDEHAGLFHDTAADAEALMRRPSDPTDNASPSGASATTSALITAAALAGPDRAARYRSAAEQALTRAGLIAERAPRFAGHWMAAAEALAHGPTQVAVAGETDEDRTALSVAARRHAPGGAVAVAGPPEAEEVPLLAGRPLVDGRAAAYVCRGYVCDRPVTSVEDLVSALAR